MKRGYENNSMIMTCGYPRSVWQNPNLVQYRRRPWQSLSVVQTFRYISSSARLILDVLRKKGSDFGEDNPSNCNPVVSRGRREWLVSIPNPSLERNPLKLYRRICFDGEITLLEYSLMKESSLFLTLGSQFVDTRKTQIITTVIEMRFICRESVVEWQVSRVEKRRVFSLECTNQGG